MIQATSLKLKFQIAYFTLIRTVMNSGYRMVYPLLPLFASGLGVDLAVLATAFSVRSFLGVLIPFLTAFAETRGRKTGMLLGLGFFTLGCSIVAIWPGFITFVIASSLVVVGNGVFIPSMQAYLGDRVPYERRGTVLSITELSWALGFIIGIPLLGALILRINWVAPFILLAGLGLILSSTLLWLIPNEASTQKADQAMLQNLKQVVSYWPALAGLLMSFLFASANETVNLVFGVWIEAGFGLAFATMSAATIVIGTSELASELLSALIIDRMGKKRAIMISLLLNSLSALLLPLLGSNLINALVGLGFFYLTFEFTLISTITIMSEVLPNARATLMATTVASFSLGHVLGALIAPGLFAHGFWASCLATVALNALSLVFLSQVKVIKETADSAIPAT